MTTVDLTKELGDALNRESERSVIAQFNGADPSLVAGELRVVLEAAMTHAPRSLQTRIGPSELGIECERCLAHKLAGTTERPEAAWLPTSGTAVHEWCESVVLRHEHTRYSLGMTGRYLPECEVTVGQVGGIPITGHTDVFDTHSGTVVDYKYVGSTTLKAAKGKGVSLQYQRQAHLYGRGWALAGYTVKSVCIWMLPRNGLTLADGYVWQAPYDESVAVATLDRADNLATLIAEQGLQQVLAMLPPHDGSGFSCKKFPDYLPANLDPKNPFNFTK